MGPYPDNVPKTPVYYYETIILITIYMVKISAKVKKSCILDL